MENLKIETLEQLYRDAFPAVARMVAQLGGDMDSAKDVFHDALIVYMEKELEQTLDIKVSAQAYLVGIARILWKRKYNSEARYIALKSMDDLTVPADFYLTEKTISPDLSTYLTSSGKKCMELLQAFYYEKQSMQEIADRYNYKTRHSATVQKHKCLEKVRQQLKRTEMYETTIA